MFRLRLALSYWSILTAVVVAGCSAEPASTPGLSLPAQPTATVLPPASPTVAPQPTPTFPPEIVATQVADIVGVWKLNYRGAMGLFPASLTIREDASFTLEDTARGAPLSSGLVLFADGKVFLDSEAWFDVSVGTFPYQMAFVIYASLYEGQPLRLRFESAEETSDPRTSRFHMNFDGKVLLPAEE